MKHIFKIFILLFSVSLLAQTGPTQTFNGRVVFKYQPVTTTNTKTLTVNPITGDLEFKEVLPVNLDNLVKKSGETNQVISGTVTSDKLIITASPVNSNDVTDKEYVDSGLLTKAGLDENGKVPMSQIYQPSILKQSFIYSGSSTFTLSSVPTNILGVYVNGQSLNGVGPSPVQYISSGTNLTISQPLSSGDDISVIYDSLILDSVSYTKAETDALIAPVGSGYQGSITTTSLSPTNIGFYIPTQTGTYTNYGGLVVDLSQGVTLITYDGVVFDKQIVPIDLTSYATNKSVESPIEVTDQFFEKVFSKTYESFDDVVNPPLRQDTTSTFSGWECTIGTPQNFQKAVFKIRVRSTIVNTIKVRIYDNDAATVLAEKTLTGLNLTPLTTHDITVDFEDVITNSLDHKLMFGYLCDQLVDRIGITNGTTIYPYPEYPGTKYATNGGQNFGVMTNTNTTSRLNFVELYSENGFNPLPELADELKPLIPEIQQVSKLVDVNNVSIDVVNEISGTENFPISDAIWRDNTSTFSGWGTSIGVHNNFNAILFKLKPRSTPITSVYYELRETNKNGNLLASGYLTVETVASTEKDIVIELPSISNSGNLPLWFGFQANQICDLFAHLDGSLPFTPSYAAYKTTGAQTPGTWTDISSGERNIWVKTGLLVLNTFPTDQFALNIASKLNITPQIPVCDIIIPDEIYGVELIENNIYFKNSIITPYGVDDDDFTVDITGTKGAQYNRRWKYTPGSSDSGTYTLQTDVRNKRDIISTKSTSLKIADSGSGNGINRKVLIIGDSTVDGDDITTPLKSYFDSDVMGVTFIGTRGATGLKHEGRGGWTYNDYATVGRTYFKFNITGLTSTPGLGSIYSTNGSQYTVEEVNVTDGTGYFSSTRSSGGANPLTSGTLTRVSGSGDNSISYGSYEIISGNPFWNAGTSSFDFQNYLTTTSQTMASGDWVFFQLGINDVFGITSLSAAETKTATMYSQLQTMITNIQSSIPGIRIGVLLVLPPAANQDAFAVNYNNGQTREMYLKTGWLTWNKKLLSDFDTPENRSLNRFIVTSCLNLDPDYGFPTSNTFANARSTQNVTIQSNAVHPSVSGNLQISDSYIGIIKNMQ